MRRRRRTKTTGVPPPPQIKVPTPKASELKEIYKKLITANISNRISAFAEGLDWYDAAIPFFMGNLKKGLSPDNIKKLSQANKSRNLAIGAGTDQEREAAYLRAISLLEKIWENERIISYKKYYKEYEEQRTTLEAREKKAAEKFQVVLEALNAAFKDINLEFVLVKSTNSGADREYDGEGKILLTINLAKVLNAKVREEGLLPVLMSEAKTALSASGIEKITDPDNPGNIKQVPNLGRMVRNFPVVLNGIMNYISNAPRNKVFKQFSGVLEAASTPAGAAATTTANVSTPKVRVHKVSTGPKVHKTPRGGAGKVGGRYAPGSAMAILYERLEDQKPHSLSDIFKGLSVGNPMDRLRYLCKHGDRSGNWHITISGSVVQMIKP